MRRSNAHTGADGFTPRNQFHRVKAALQYSRRSQTEPPDLVHRFRLCRHHEESGMSICSRISRQISYPLFFGIMMSRIRRSNFSSLIRFICLFSVRCDHLMPAHSPDNPAPRFAISLSSSASKMRAIIVSSRRHPPSVFSRPANFQHGLFLFHSLPLFRHGFSSQPGPLRRMAFSFTPCPLPARPFPSRAPRRLRQIHIST